MAQSQLFAPDEVTFNCEAELPYGTELVINDRLAPEHSPHHFALCSHCSGIEKVKIQSGNVSGQRLVVIKQSHSEGSTFCYVAVPSERLEEQCANIEEAIVRSLLRS
jgi:hypothetical protein